MSAEKIIADMRRDPESRPSKCFCQGEGEGEGEGQSEGGEGRPAMR